MKRMTVFVLSVIAGACLILSANSFAYTANIKRHFGVRFTKHARHHFGSAGKSNSHNEILEKAHLQAHSHDHNGNEHQAAEHAKAHKNSHALAHIHDHRDFVRDASGHAHHHIVNKDAEFYNKQYIN